MSGDARAGTTTARAVRCVQGGSRLSRAEATAAFLPILQEGFRSADLAWGALFAALSTRGPTVEEIRGLLDAIFTFDPDLAGQLADKLDLSALGSVLAITGSGKETFKTFNVSTAAALVAACHPGVCVVKPAGRATSAMTGASDVLEELGVRLPSALGQVVAVAKRVGICIFDYHLVAPRYGPRYEGRFHHFHPLSHVTPWLFLPFALDGVVFGVGDRDTKLAASVMTEFGIHRAVVATTDLGAHGRIDEAAPFGTTVMTHIVAGSMHTTVNERPIPFNLSDVGQRDSHHANAKLLRAVLDGTGPPLARSLVSVNAALLLQVAGVADDEASALADKYIDRGDARRKLEACAQATWEES